MVPKRASKATKTPAVREPRVSVSKTGGAGRRPGPTAVAGDSSDILDRLAKLGDASVVADDTADKIALPAIVEADPTYPPLPSPTAERLWDATVESGDAIVRPTEREASPAPEPPSSTPSETSVSADLATALVAVATEPDAAVLVDPAEAFAPAPERTVVVPVAPTEIVPGQPLPATAVDETSGVVLPKRPLRAPMVFRRAKPRVRRVTRVVRHVDTWSVFKVAFVFNVILYSVCLTSAVLLWNVAHATGTVDNVEKFFEQFGWESFEFKGGEIYHNGWIGGLFVAVGLTGFAVLLATLFNLITDLVGGIRVSVLEEEVIAKPRSASTKAVGGDGDATDGIQRP